MKPVHKVSSNSEYLKNRSRGLEVIGSQSEETLLRVRESHSPVGLVSRQWDTTDWACVLCDRRIHKSPHFQRRFCFGKSQKSQGAKSGLWRDWQIWVMRFFAQKKSLHESNIMGRPIDADSLICSFGHRECDGHRVHNLSQRHLTADWLGPRDGDCSRMRSEVSFDWLPRYIKATRPVLEIFKMAGYFPDWPRMPLQNIILSRWAPLHSTVDLISVINKGR